jgi:hypothetical protein
MFSSALITLRTVSLEACRPDCVHQHTAGFFHAVVNRNFISRAAQIKGGGKA